MDSDGDGIPDGDDNCPYAPNPGQADDDLNNVGNANPVDYNDSAILVDYLSTVGLIGDIDGDGVVGFSDVTKFIENWLASCP